MATKEEISKRREKVFQLKTMGVSIYDMPQAVNVSVHTIMRDCDAMEEMISEAMKDEPTFIEKLKVETMSILRGAYKELWRQYASANDPRDKAVIVKMIVDTVDKKCSILQRLGVLSSQPAPQINNIVLSWKGNEKKEDEKKDGDDDRLPAARKADEVPRV